jgi:Uma2 family endonuclease
LRSTTNKTKWDLWDGVLVKKPPMSVMHDDFATYLGVALANQLDRAVFRVSVNGAKTRYTARNYFIPDVAVIPASLVLPRRSDPTAFNDYSDPLPLVVEFWSRTTGDYDFVAKLPVYQQRGDREIWYIHPYERTLTARRQPDGTYTEEVYRGGIVPVLSLPGVAIDLDALNNDCRRRRQPRLTRSSAGANASTAATLGSCSQTWTSP